MITGRCHCLQNTAAAVVNLVQNGRRGFADQESAQSRGKTEYLVEGENDEIGGILGKVEVMRWRVGCCIQQNEPSSRTCKLVLAVDLGNPLLREQLAGKVLFQRVSKEIVDGIGRVSRRGSASLLHVRAVHHMEGGAMSESDLANSQHGIVVLTQVVKVRLVCPRKRFSNQMKTRCCSGGKHHIVVVTIRVEPLENDFTRFLGKTTPSSPPPS